MSLVSLVPLVTQLLWSFGFRFPMFCGGFKGCQSEIEVGSRSERPERHRCVIEVNSKSDGSEIDMESK